MPGFHGNFLRAKQELGNRDRARTGRSFHRAHCGAGQVRQGNHKILFGVRQMAIEAAFDIGIGFFIGFAIRRVGGILPVTIAPSLRNRRAPAGALFHYGDTDWLALDEIAFGISHGFAVGIHAAARTGR